MRTNILADKSFEFAVRIVKLHKYLKKNFVEYEISKQIVRSGTAIGALIMESEYAFSKKDFVFKLIISLKEANETRYWLRLLYRTDYLTKKIFDSMVFDCEELIKILTSSVKTTNTKLSNVSK
jgi:four helix bundle protein